ncbi:MAG TPA: hypothetical protein DHU59_11415, partial [Clostridiales bacterium]|nr:hypothetical protein [Clostridiales bacterium]
LKSDLSTQEVVLLSNFNKLNGIGQNEANKRVEELTYIDKYTKKTDKVINIHERQQQKEYTYKIAETSSTEYSDHIELNAARPKKEATGEYQQHDDDIMDDPNF